MRRKRKGNNNQKSSKKQKLIQSPVEIFVNGLLFKNNFAWLDFMKFTSEQKAACGEKFVVVRDEKTGEGINVEENNKKRKRNQKKELQCLEYPLVTALMNGENIKLIEELLKVTPSDFLTEIDDKNQNIFIKMFQRTLDERQQTEEYFIVELLIAFAKSKNITLNWMTQDFTFSKNKTALEYALSNRVDNVAERLLDLILPSIVDHSSAFFNWDIIESLMDEAFNSFYPKPRTIKKLISQGGTVKKNHLIIFEKIKKESKSRNTQTLTEECIEIFKNSQIDVQSCLFKNSGSQKNIKIVNKVIANSFKEEMSQQSWFKIEEDLVKPYPAHRSFNLKGHLDTINDSLKKIEDKTITFGMWFNIAVDAIRKNHPLIHTLIQKGLDLNQIFDRKFKLSLNDYIALYSYDEELLEDLDSSSTSCNAFGLTLAHYAALAYPKNIPSRERFAAKEVVTFEPDHQFGSVEKFQKFFSVTSAFDTDFLGFTAIDYFRMNPDYAKKSELFQIIGIVLRQSIEMLTSFLQPLMPAVLSRIVFEYINIPLKRDRFELKDEIFIANNAITENMKADKLTRQWASTFIKKTKGTSCSSPSLDFRNILVGYLNQFNIQRKDVLNCLKQYASLSLLCENITESYRFTFTINNGFIFTFNKEYTREFAAQILNIKLDKENQDFVFWDEFGHNQDPLPPLPSQVLNVLGSGLVGQGAPQLPSHFPLLHPTTEQFSKDSKDPVGDDFGFGPIAPLDSSSSSFSDIPLNLIPPNDVQKLLNTPVNSPFHLPNGPFTATEQFSKDSKDPVGDDFGFGPIAPLDSSSSSFSDIPLNLIPPNDVQKLLNTPVNLPFYWLNGPFTATEKFSKDSKDPIGDNFGFDSIAPLNSSSSSSSNVPLNLTPHNYAQKPLNILVNSPFRFPNGPVVPETFCKDSKDPLEDEFLFEPTVASSSGSSSLGDSLLNLTPNYVQKPLNLPEPVVDLTQVKLNGPRSPRFFTSQNKNSPSLSNISPIAGSFSVSGKTASQSSNSSSSNQVSVNLTSSNQSSNTVSLAVPKARFFTTNRDKLIATLNSFCRGGMNKRDLAKELDPFIERLKKNDDPTIVLAALKAEMNKDNSKLHSIAEKYGLVANINSLCGNEAFDDYDSDTESLGY